MREIRAVGHMAPGETAPGNVFVRCTICGDMAQLVNLRPWPEIRRTIGETACCHTTLSVPAPTEGA